MSVIIPTAVRGRWLCLPAGLREPFGGQEGEDLSRPYPCRCGEAGRWDLCGRRPLEFLEFWRGPAGQGCPCFGRRDFADWSANPQAPFPPVHCCGRSLPSLAIAGRPADRPADRHHGAVVSLWRHD